MLSTCKAMAMKFAELYRRVGRHAYVVGGAAQNFVIDIPVKDRMSV